MSSSSSSSSPPNGNGAEEAAGGIGDGVRAMISEGVCREGGEGVGWVYKN